MGRAVRRLTADDAAVFRDIRLEGLRLHPEAFASSFEEESAQALEWFADSLTRNAVFGAFQDGILQGIAGFYARRHDKMKHKGALWGLYLREAARGSGLAQALVEAVEGHARQEVEVLSVSVITSNRAARRLYEQLGYVCYGTEPNALRVEGRDYDEALLEKRLR